MLSFNKITLKNSLRRLVGILAGPIDE